MLLSELHLPGRWGTVVSARRSLKLPLPLPGAFEVAVWNINNSTTHCKPTLEAQTKQQLQAIKYLVLASTSFFLL
jgi:hypothetical protein